MSLFPPHMVHITWQNIRLTVTHQPDIYNLSSKGLTPVDHIEISSSNDKPLPITETGNKSHFVHPDNIAEYGCAIEFVKAWLDHEANKPAWKTYIEQSRQMGLF